MPVEQVQIGSRLLKHGAGWCRARQGRLSRPSSLRITGRSPPDCSEESASVRKVGLWSPAFSPHTPLSHSSPCSLDGYWPPLNSTAFSLRFSPEHATPQINLLSHLMAVQAFLLNNEFDLVWGMCCIPALALYPLIVVVFFSSLSSFPSTDPKKY